MRRGFTKAWRKELDSRIWQMPPIYHRVWYWLRLKVQHEPYLFPTSKGFGIWVLPGQRITSFQQIAEGVAWTEWGKEKVPNKKTIKEATDWLEAEGMICVESNALGTVISITNWDSYNHNSTDESNAGVTPTGLLSGTLSGHKKRMIKNVEEGEELKPKVKRFVPPSFEEVHEYMLQIDFKGDAQKWVDFYTGKGWMVGKNKMVDWKAAVRTWRQNDSKKGASQDDYRESIFGNNSKTQ